jgi:RNA-directed DNA polymerase
MVYFSGDDLLAASRPRGLPIGNLTSQFWANCYLNSFDHFIKREMGCRAYLRFVDDFLLFGDSKRQLHQWRQQIETRLAHYRLSIHPGTHPRPVTEGVSFLGFIVFPQYRRLKRRKGIHFRRKLNRLITDYADGIIDFEQVTASVQGWINHTRYGNTIGLRKAVLTAAVIPKRHQQKDMT